MLIENKIIGINDTDDTGSTLAHKGILLAKDLFKLSIFHILLKKLCKIRILKLASH